MSIFTSIALDFWNNQIKQVEILQHINNPPIHFQPQSTLSGRSDSSSE